MDVELLFISFVVFNSIFREMLYFEKKKHYTIVFETKLFKAVKEDETILSLSTIFIHSPRIVYVRYSARILNEERRKRWKNDQKLYKQMYWHFHRGRIPHTFYGLVYVFKFHRLRKQ